ncbi:unnamed protein product [Clonostachys solani]|uniref:Exocyst complex component Sec3 PIP2-binding N-terminal domain-containing protein n=1 Tax=Clonostachys solani TaxID=160281 RepID=A0A9N9Z3Q4_9HYPO|nr:unnamed protein product [Clonostachys solani]
MERTNGNGFGPATPGTREKFEDEKRRIIESCFSKREPDGTPLCQLLLSSIKLTSKPVQETYITHLRITEFSTHPATPPPPQARTPDSQKPRAIIIAVRKSGRVRMHKSKENPNGTFSIGKTWNLDDLTHIESFTSPQANPQHREWAGDTGFIVTLVKPYFWLAQSDKEKKFFIASMIKIYGKYTGGLVPELLGFDPRELEQVMGAGKRPPPNIGGQYHNGPPPMRPPQGISSPPSMPGHPNFPPHMPGSHDGPPRATRTPPIRQQPPSGTNSPAGSFDSSASRDRDRTNLRKVVQNSKSQESMSMAVRNGPPGPQAEPPTQPLPQIPNQHGPSRSRDDQTPPMPLPLMRPPSRAARDEQAAQNIPSPSRGREDQTPPERKRPPMDPTRPQDRDLVPAPLIPGTGGPGKKDPVMPPPRSAERAGRKNSTSQGPNHPPALTPSLGTDSTPTVPIQSPEVPKSDFTSGGLNSLPIPSPTVNIPLPVTGKEALTLQTDIEQPSKVSPVSAAAPTSGPQEETSAKGDETTAKDEDKTDEEERPGLGPMIKSPKTKEQVAGAFWKAAAAAAAFKPRRGGAGERLRLAAQKTTDGPDGITDVVPAPPKPDTPKEDSAPPTPDVPARAPQRRSNIPDVKVAVPSINRPLSGQGASSLIKEIPESFPKEPARPVRAVGKDSEYLQSLSVDHRILDNRSEGFGRWLDHFGWIPGEQMQSGNVDDMRADLERELNKTQAGGWLARFQEEDDKVDAIKLGIDVAILECEELDNLLTLYSVELSTLSEDIAYIEAQGQGLQVQAANQKLLKQELESLLETCAITTTDLQVLRTAPLDNIQGLSEVENSLVVLFKAMIKIDPSLGGREPGKAGDSSVDDQALGLDSDYGNMRIVQEKKEMYVQESSHFMQHLIGFMPQQFDLALAETKRALSGALAKRGDSSHHEAGRDVLWKYGPLMLYARDVDLKSWSQMLGIYQEKSHPVYKNEFQTIMMSCRKNARKMTSEEQVWLFTTQIEKQQENVATAARKMTVKRSQTLARALRSPLSEGKADRQKAGSGTLPWEVFSAVLDELLPLVEMEQNFIIDFFHATTLEQTDFPDAVASSTPQDRGGGDLKKHRIMEPDRDLARRVTRSMETIFSFLDHDLQKLMEWVISQDPLQGVGMFVAVEKKMADISQTNQDFINTIFQKQHGLLGGRFRKFVDDQIRAIEETKVKIHKRKGVIHFIRVFPAFSTVVENMLVGIDPNLPIRRTVDREYDRMLKSMFDSLLVIARENPAVGVTSGGGDPEDKEALNFHILLIENMNHFVEETDTRGLDVLEIWKNNASREYHEHMGLYLNAVMRRPLGKLLDHLENIEAQLQSGKAPNLIAAQPSNTKTIFNKILGNYDSKEVRKGIEALRKRVEKHFGDADDPALSRDLVANVIRESEKFYVDVESRIGRIITDVYEGDVLFEWPRADVKAAFK